MPKDPLTFGRNLKNLTQNFTRISQLKNPKVACYKMLRDLSYAAIDLPFRLRNAIKRRLSKANLFSNQTDKSDSQVTFYENSVTKIITNPKKFKSFRRVYDYREILEHVNFKLGIEYLERIRFLDSSLVSRMDKFKVNDEIGNPRRYSYYKIGKISPTTLRYVAVAADIKSKFGNFTGMKIAEIGGGYGGQALVISQFATFESYHIFDLPDVQSLINRYLAPRDISGLYFPDPKDKNTINFDLVVSNYAFSELPRAIQEHYLQNVILKSKKGYMLMNSGLSNQTGRSNGKYSLEELKQLIPSIRVEDEVPLTSADNYLITWERP